EGLQQVLDQTDDVGLTPLHKAAERGSTEIVELLLHRGARIERTTRASFPLRGNHIRGVPPLGCVEPIHLAALNGHDAVVRTCLRNGGNVDCQTPSQLSVRHIAAAGVHEKAVEALLSHGSDVNPQDHSKRSPLHLAAAVGYEAVVRSLL